MEFELQRNLKHTVLSSNGATDIVKYLELAEDEDGKECYVTTLYKEDTSGDTEQLECKLHYNLEDAETEYERIEYNA